MVSISGILILLPVLWLSAYGCKGGRTTVVKSISHIKVKYSLPNPPSSTRNDTLASSTEYTPSNKKFCKNVRPGLHHMSYGINQFYINYNKSDGYRPLSKLFDFDCSSSIVDDKHYQMPNEVENITFSKEGLQQEYFHMYKSKTELYEKESGSYGLLPFLLALSSSLTSIDEYATSLMTVSYIKSIYTVKLYSDLKPTQSFLDAYEKLPNIYEGHEDVFHNFIMTYGTDFYTDSVFGGRLLIVVKSHDISEEKLEKTKKLTPSKNITLITTEFDKYETKITPQYFAEGEDFNFGDNFAKWSKTVSQDPKPISGTLRPLPWLIEKNNASDKYNAFMKAREHERIHQELKRVKIQLGQPKDFNIVQKSISTFLDSEIKFVAPRIEVLTGLQGALKIDGNMTKYFIGCQLADKNIKDGKTEQVTQMYYVIPGLCITVPKIRECKEVLSELPKNQNSIKFFKEPDCSSNYEKVSNIKKLTYNLKNVQSFFVY